jgi:hypothetical protein
MAKLPVESSSESAPRILEIRGQRVLLDSDLAELNGVTTKRRNEKVRRNGDRFPADFLMELSNEELAALRSQIATSKIHSLPAQNCTPVNSRDGRSDARFYLGLTSST